MLLSRLISDVHHLAFPPRCAVCGEAGLEAQPVLCGGCSLELGVLSATPMCERCAMPVGSPGGDCPHCSGRGVYPFDKIVALGPLRDPLKRLIHQAKYHHRWPLAETLCDIFLQHERAKGVLQISDCIVPVPLHWSRQLGRGYNQAQVIAARLGKLCGKKAVHPLARLKNTETQTAVQSRAGREANVQRAFGLIRPNQVRGRHVLIVDDVTTTVSTLRSAARAIRAGEPASLNALVLAVADPRGRDFSVI